MSTLQKTMLKSKFPPSGLESSSARACKARALQKKRDYEPVEWHPYFDECKEVKLGDNSFNVYLKGTEGPTLVLLHGGGYSGLTWAEFTKSITSMVICKVMAIDLRGHGDSHTTDDQDLSVDTLVNDIKGIVDHITEGNSVILVGHSMGGALAVRTGPHLTNLIGTVVIDVVEGTAMDALTSMQSFLRSRPSSFNSIIQAIEWCVRSGQIRNVQSAKVSVPGQIKNIITNKLATHDVKECITSAVGSNEPGNSSSISIEREDVIPEDTISEETEDLKDEIQSDFPKPVVNKNKKYEWRINLAKTENHWSGWFKGLSEAFLNVPGPKMLLLAGIDRLDKELTVGQMQGKFQMQVLPACGHAVHEDVPDKVAEVIATFLVRNKFVEQASDFHHVFPTF